MLSAHCTMLERQRLLFSYLTNGRTQGWSRGSQTLLVKVIEPVQCLMVFIDLKWIFLSRQWGEDLRSTSGLELAIGQAVRPGQ